MKIIIEWLPFDAKAYVAAKGKLEGYPEMDEEILAVIKSHHKNADGSSYFFLFFGQIRNYEDDADYSEEWYFGTGDGNDAYSLNQIARWASVYEMEDILKKEILNEETKKALEETDAGIGLQTAGDVNELFEKILDLKEALGPEFEKSLHDGLDGLIEVDMKDEPLIRNNDCPFCGDWPGEEAHTGSGPYDWQGNLIPGERDVPELPEHSHYVWNNYCDQIREVLAARAGLEPATS